MDKLYYPRPMRLIAENPSSKNFVLTCCYNVCQRIKYCISFEYRGEARSQIGNGFRLWNRGPVGVLLMKTPGIEKSRAIVPLMKSKFPRCRSAVNSNILTNLYLGLNQLLGINQGTT
jgi:hypothetical protein